jgi:hypothetical protein
MAATVYILTTDRSVLPLSDQEPIGYFAGIVGGVAGIAVLFFLARRRAPPDHRNAPDFANPGKETAGLLAWIAAVLAIGSVFDIRTHIAFVGLAPGAQAVWDRQTPATTLTWAIFNFVALAVLPYLFFRYRLGYRQDSMLLRGVPRVGLLKAITTLRTGNAWLHIAITHTIHLAEAPAVATTFTAR